MTFSSESDVLRTKILAVTMSVGVIGGGPSAAATVMGLLAGENLQITLISSSVANSATNEFENLHTASTKKKQRSKRKYTSFDFDKNFLLNVKNSKAPPSNLMSGGWSKIWGATLGEWAKDAEIHKDVSAQALEYEYQAIRKYVPSLENSEHPYRSSLVQTLIEDFQKRSTLPHTTMDKFRVFPSNLAIWNKVKQSNSCVFCAKCLSGCEVQAIYSADQTLEIVRREASSKFLINAAYAEKIEEMEDKIRVHLNNEKYLDFDYIFVASGLISSVGLLQRSGLVKDICFQETPMFLIPLISLKHQPRVKLSEISLSEAFVEILDTLKEDVIGSGQIYSFTKNLQEVAFGSTTSKFIKFIPRFLTNRLIIVMLFTKPSNESQITIRNRNGVSEIVFPRRYHRRNYKKVIKQLHSNFSKVGFWSIFRISVLESPGLSYHYAGAHDEMTKVPISDKYGLLKNATSQRIFLSDACALTNIEPGPITMTIMANSRRIAKEFVECSK